MNELSNEMLMDTYVHAVQLNLDDHFILLLEKELSRRNLYHFYH
ncbi:MAG TPA: sporulation histidine kinase inhibitor Sda [Candidatus Pseudogracilibacillus intestinigallinarum]|uniref:Sporulation histidine kinase inhibitor Sda n=1 Tax=Candidatus Pseudogracilibacillus intestinigallinarum TaxID=2838742 RepID=A0A9D1TL85_9BACI|nr:sporulation histidine kinase inhibitor Sda [Candidatus Pseudogracilibacillus intestinigallinarum]